MFPNRTTQRRLRRSVRNGIAATECALVLPTIVLITFGTVQLCKGMLLKETATVAAYEAARIAIQYEGTSTSATSRATQIVQDRGVSTTALSGSMVSITPNPVTAAPLTPIYVTVRLPCSGNLVFPGGGPYGWMGSSDVAATVVMLNEYKP